MSAFKKLFDRSLLQQKLTGNNALLQSSLFPDKIHLILLYSSFTLLFLGFKLWTIRSYGNAVPFWDQWDAEAAGLYKPYLDGTLSLKHLFINHNEHRIFTTRLWALGLLIINKTWNPLLQMVANAGVHCVTIMLFVSLLARVLGRQNLPGLLVFALPLFSIPYGWENTLAGFQVQFYFVVFFSVAAIWLMVTGEPFSRRWWNGFVCGILSFLSLASGLFAFATVSLMSFIFYFTGNRTSIKQLLSGTICALMFIACFMLTPVLEHQQVYKAHTFPDFYHSLKISLGWPVSHTIVSALVRNLPIFVFVPIILLKRPPVNDRRWFLLALCVWSMVQVVSVAYGRAAGPLSPRYKDLHAIPIFVNFACLISLTQMYINRWRLYSQIGLAAWSAILLTSLAFFSIRDLPGELNTKRTWNLAEEKNTRNYIITKDISHLKNKPDMHVPLPDPDRLATTIELPGIREILPGNINSPLQAEKTDSGVAGAFVTNGFPGKFLQNIDTSWGSFTMLKDSAMGQLSLQFHTNYEGRKIEIPVAGYPKDSGMVLEIEQNGQRTPLKISDNPGEKWGAAYARLKSGDFTIHVADSNARAWVAVRRPAVLGNLDGFINRLLWHSYDKFIIAGIVLAMLLIIQAGITYKKQN
jgi:hypothetical protein